MRFHPPSFRFTNRFSVFGAFALIAALTTGGAKASVIITIGGGGIIFPPSPPEPVISSYELTNVLYDDFVYDPKRNILYISRFDNGGVAVDQLDVSSKQLLSTLASTVYSYPAGIDLSPNHDLLAITGGSSYEYGKSNVTLVDLVNGTSRVIDATGPNEDWDNIWFARDVAFLNDDTLLVSSHSSGPSPITQVDLHSNIASTVGRARDGALMRSSDGSRTFVNQIEKYGAPQGSARIFDSELRAFIGPQLWSTPASAFGPDGSFAANGQIWTKDFVLDREFQISGLQMEGLAFSPVSDVLYVAASNSNQVFLFALNSMTFERLAQFDVIGNPYSYDTMQLSISNDGRTLFALTDLGVKIYDVGIFAESKASTTSTADFNADGVVDGADFLIWQRHAGSNAPANSNATGDANLNGIVNSDDLMIWQSAMRSAGAGVQSVPEPTSGLLATASIIAVLAFRGWPRLAYSPT